MRPKNATGPYRWCSADAALDAVELWARDRMAVLLRETGQVVADRRLDGLLIPAGFGAQVPIGLTGIEVKVHRGDFLRGLNGGQYDAYIQGLNALYIATPRGEVKTSEIPLKFGHLVVGNRQGLDHPVCVCRRRAPWHDFTPDQKTLWQILFGYLNQVALEKQAEHEKLYRLRRNIGEIGAKKIRHILSGVGSE